MTRIFARTIAITFYVQPDTLEETMPGFDGHRLPPPLDWQKFQRLCRDLWAEIWGDENAQENGRNGQPQHGVDVFGHPASGAGFSGIQCKLQDGTDVAEQELRDEVAKARKFEPPLQGAFILATTASRDAKIQAVARLITEEHAAQGLFSVHVWAWDDIQSEIGKRSVVFATHFADLVETIRALDRAPRPQLAGELYATSPYARGNSALAIVGSSGDGESILTPEHRAQIDAISALLKKGEAKLALEQAEALRGRIWAAASGPTRARLLALLGHAQLDLGEEQVAGKLLVQTIDHAPGEPGSQANAALGHLLLGSDRAAQSWAAKALAQAPTNAIAIQVSVILDGRSDEEISAAYETTLGTKAEVFLALGQRALRRRDLSVAQKWFDRAAELAPEEASILAVAGQTAIDRVALRVGLEGIATASDRSELERAIARLDRAWKLLRDDDSRRAHATWIASRTFAKHLVGAEDAATSGDELLRIGGDHDEFVMLRASIASRMGDHERVVALIDRLKEPNPDARGARAAARANLGDLAGSTTEWEALLALDLYPDLRSQVERNYVHVLVDLDRVVDARAILSQWLAEKPDDLARLLIAIETGARIGNRALRDSHLERAVTLARADVSARLLLRLGDALMGA